MQNNRIYLRAFIKDDYLTTIQWRNDSEIWKMVCGPKHYVSPEYEKIWVENAIFDQGNIKLAICTINGDEHIGMIYLENIDWINRSAELGYLIGDKNYWGCGYALEAINQILEFAFSERGLNRITIDILESNTRSLRVAQKIGAKKEGIFREAAFKNGHYQNIVRLSILYNEYLALEK